MLLTSCSWDFLPPSQDIQSHDYVHVIEAKDGFEILFDSGATKKVSEYYTSWSIVINGSYFWVTESWVYYPAGYWEIARQPIVIPDIWKQTNPVYNDPNITHFVGITGSAIDIFSNKEYYGWPEIYDSMFQSWPLVLSGNILQPFSDSWHARGPHERTLLGKTQSGKVYFFIFEKPVSLTEVADIIVKDDRFTIDPITLLNLDGWPSTAYYDGENGFRENAKLPIIFLIRT